MILSVLSPGHRYWREEGGLLHPHTTLQSILSGETKSFGKLFLTYFTFNKGHPMPIVIHMGQHVSGKIPT